MREYNRIRDGLRKVVLRPETPLDQMTGADYCRMKKNALDVMGRRIK